MGQAVQNVDSDLVIIERNVSRVVSTDASIRRDGKILDEKGRTVSDETGAEKLYRHIFEASQFEPEGAYEINVVSRDEAGNEMESREENGKVVFYVDRTPPTIAVDGIDPKGVNADKATLTVKATDLLTGIDSIKAEVDGTEVNLSETEDDGIWTFTVDEGIRQPIKVTAQDKAGNEAVFEDSISVSASAVRLWFDRIGKFFLGGAAGAAALGGGWFLLGKRRKDDDEEKAGENAGNEADNA